MATELTQQAEFIHKLSDVSTSVKGARDAQRQTTLVHELQNLSSTLPPVFRLSLNPALQCCDIDIEVLVAYPIYIFSIFLYIFIELFFF